MLPEVFFYATNKYFFFFIKLLIKLISIPRSLCAKIRRRSFFFLFFGVNVRWTFTGAVKQQTIFQSVNFHSVTRDKNQPIFQTTKNIIYKTFKYNGTVQRATNSFVIVHLQIINWQSSLIRMNEMRAWMCSSHNKRQEFFSKSYHTLGWRLTDFERPSTRSKNEKHERAAICCDSTDGLRETECYIVWQRSKLRGICVRA